MWNLVFYFKQNSINHFINIINLNVVGFMVLLLLNLVKWIYIILVDITKIKYTWFYDYKYGRKLQQK
jgi:hypothetical protein